MKNIKILAINPGSTSTKIALFENNKEIFSTTIRHSSEELLAFKKIADQFQFRKDLIVKELKKNNINIDEIDAIVGRGGLVKPIASGTYEVTENLKHDLKNPPMGEHASNLGGLIAEDMAASIKGARAFIADPVVVDEMDEVARVSGHALFNRLSIFHALNHKAVARDYAKSVSKRYEDMNLIVAHMGGGISVGAHRKGMVVDVNNALDGEGGFSPERSGTLPAGQLAEICFSGKYTYEQVKQMIVGKGGMVSHLGTNDARDARERADAGDKHAALIVDALSYNVGKQIGAMAAVLKGEVDAILITGGIAYSSRVCDYIKSMVEFIAPVEIFPGEDEMQALANSGYMVLTGELSPKEY